MCFSVNSLHSFFIKTTIALCISSAMLAPVYVNAKSQHSVADSASQVATGTLIDATPLKRKPPNYPYRLGAKNAEGWVQLSYVVEPDGSTSNITLIDHAGHDAFVREAKRAVKKWRFDPAKQDGVAVAQCNNKVQLDFVMGGTKHGASKRFVQKYQFISRLVSENKLDEALGALKDIDPNELHNFYEQIKFQLVYSQVQGLKKDYQGELVRLNKIIFSHRDLARYIGDEAYSQHLLRGFILAIQSNQFGLTRQYFDKIAELGNDTLVGELTPYMQQMENIIQSPKNIAVLPHLTNTGVFSHTLVRSQFAFVGDVSEMSQLEVRCANTFEVLEPLAEKIYKIPSSWQDCQILMALPKENNVQLVEVANS